MRGGEGGCAAAFQTPAMDAGLRERRRCVARRCVMHAERGGRKTDAREVRRDDVGVRTRREDALRRALAEHAKAEGAVSRSVEDRGGAGDVNTGIEGEARGRGGEWECALRDARVLHAVRFEMGAARYLREVARTAGVASVRLTRIQYAAASVGPLQSALPCEFATSAAARWVVPVPPLVLRRAVDVVFQREHTEHSGERAADRWSERMFQPPRVFAVYSNTAPQLRSPRLSSTEDILARETAQEHAYLDYSDALRTETDFWRADTVDLYSELRIADD